MSDAKPTYYWLALALLLWLGLSPPVQAHRFAPALLELEETGSSSAAVRWKQPAVRVQGSRLRPVLPADCEGIGKPRVERQGTGMEARWEIACPNGVVGKTIGVEGIASSRADVLLRVKLMDGRSVRHVLTPDQPNFTIPEHESGFTVLTTYATLGMEHILTGFDHLLFVLGLTLLVRGWRRLLWTITAFTVGHSATLALAVLGWIHVPPGPVEVGIAFSIFVLAVELARPQDRSVLRAYPWFMAGVFGLLHGLGFAGALAEVGLPEGEIPLALFSFNVGIEIGQIAFVLAVLIAWGLLRKLLKINWPRFAQLTPAYVIGSLAAFWVFERGWNTAAAAGWLSGL